MKRDTKKEDTTQSLGCNQLQGRSSPRDKRGRLSLDK